MSDDVLDQARADYQQAYPPLADWLAGLRSRARRELSALGLTLTPGDRHDVETQTAFMDSPAKTIHVLRFGVRGRRHLIEVRAEHNELADPRYFVALDGQRCGFQLNLRSLGGALAVVERP